MRTGSVVLLGVLLIGGCGDRSADGSQPVVRDSAGIRVIDLPPPSEGPPDVVLALDGHWIGGRGQEFGELEDVGVLQDGRVVLLDGLSARLTVLDADGNVDVGFGRQGAGPGEFNPLGLSRIVETDSSIVVPDAGLARITEFSLQGELMGTYPLPGQGIYPLEWREHPWGGIAYRTLNFAGPDLILRLSEDGLDTLYAFPPQTAPHNTLLAPTALWDLAPTGALVVGRSDRSVVELRDGRTAEPLWILQRPGTGAPVSDVERRYVEDVVVRSATQETGGGELSPEARAAVLSGITIAPWKPLISQVRTAPNGEVWVRGIRDFERMDRDALRVGSAEGWGGRDWEVFSAEGLPLRRVRLPDGFTPRRFTPGWIYGILADELGVQVAARVKTER